MSNIKHYLIITLLFLAAIVVYAIRSYSSQRCKILCQSDDGTVNLDEDFVENEVFSKFEQIDASLIHMVVFVDLARDCQANLFEAEEWLNPIREFDESVYNVTLFIPSDNRGKLVNNFKKTFDLKSSNLVFYGNKDLLRHLAKFGVLKLCHHQEDGLLWYQFGSQSEKQYQAFDTKLRAEIASACSL